MGLFNHDVNSEQLERIEAKLDLVVNEFHTFKHDMSQKINGVLPSDTKDSSSNLVTIDKMENMAANQKSFNTAKYYVTFDSGNTREFATKRALAQAYGISPATITRHMRNQHTITKEALDRIIDGRDNRRRQGNNTTYHVMRGNKFYKTYQTTRELIRAYHISNYTLYKYLNNQYQIQEADLLAHPVKPHTPVKEEPVFNLTK